MTDAELIAAFLRLQTTPEGTVLEVGVIEWLSSHEPSVRWQPFRTWPGSTPPTPAEVDAAQATALADRKLFRRCRVCGERCNAGHMHNANTCQGCAERTLGIVY